jgi:hypothetical protein
MLSTSLWLTQREKRDTDREGWRDKEGREEGRKGGRKGGRRGEGVKKGGREGSL